MRQSITLSVTVVLCVLAAQAQSTIPWTPVSKGDLRQASIAVPQRLSSIALNPALHYVRLPDGWTASVFAAGSAFNKPRFMSWGPNGTLFVANMNGNNILALPDADSDGIADTVIVAARGFSLGHDVRFWRDTMFVSQEAGVVKLWRSDTTTMIYDKRVTVIDKAAQPNQTGGGHRTRTLVIDTNAMKLYVSVGSRGNADRESDRACIEQYNYDGTGRRIYASGARNSVGMTLHPRTGKLWANNNGSDNQGNNIPPEWVDIVRDGGFYGYPIGYHYRNWYPLTGDYQDLKPYTNADSLSMLRMEMPAALVEAHSAPMALVFTEDGVADKYENGAFMALRGSWNRTPPSGAKIVFLRFDSDQDTLANNVEDFCTGFIRDTNSADTRWARPVGLALSKDGSVFVSLDDGKQCILKLTPPKISSVGANGSSCFELWPNPAQRYFSIRLAEAPLQIQVLDVQGAVVYSETSSGAAVQSLRVPIDGWPVGAYCVAVRTARGMITKTLIIEPR
ncbi:MAG: PQQ-dependent sugar dehydrogenase [Ignavibacteria bacterium]